MNNILILPLSLILVFLISVGNAYSVTDLKIIKKGQTAPESNVNALDLQDVNSEVDRFINKGNNKIEVYRLLNAVESKVRRNKKYKKKDKKSTIKTIDGIKSSVIKGETSKEIDKVIDSTVNDLLSPGEDTLQIELMGN